MNAIRRKMCALLVAALIVTLLVPIQVLAAGEKPVITSISETPDPNYHMIDLFWSRDDAPDSYKIYRSSVSPEGPYDLIGTTQFKGFADTDFSAETTYWYVVAAIVGTEEFRSDPKQFATGPGFEDALPAGTVSLEYLGHSAFIMSTAQNNILIDPWTPPYFGLPSIDLAGRAADIDYITVSHQHLDHNYIEAAPGAQPILGVKFNENYSYEFNSITDSIYGDVTISNVLLPHFETDFPDRDYEPNAGFIYVTGGMRIVHMGDAFGPIIDGLTEAETSSLKGTGIDILMLPVGNAFGGAHDSIKLLDVINKLEPRVVIPIHPWTHKQPFLNAAKAAGITVVEKQSTERFKLTDLPPSGTVIWNMPGSIVPETLNVESTVPADHAADVETDAMIIATFNSEVAMTDADGLKVTVSDSVYGPRDAVAILGENPRQLLIQGVSLAEGTEYTVKIPAGFVKKAAGTEVNPVYSWSFTTKSASGAQDTVPPTLISAVIAEDGMTLALGFNESLNKHFISDPTQFSLSGTASHIVAAILDPEDDADQTVVLVLSSAVRAGETVTVSIAENTLKDAADNGNAAITGFAVNNRSAVAATTHIYGDFKLPSTANASDFRVRIFKGSAVPSGEAGSVADAVYGGENSGIEVGFAIREVTGSTYIHFSLDVVPGTYSMLITVPGFQKKLEGLQVPLEQYWSFIPANSLKYTYHDTQIAYVELDRIQTGGSNPPSTPPTGNPTTGTPPTGTPPLGAQTAPSPASSSTGAEVTKQTLENGRQVVKVTFDAQKLGASLGLLKEKAQGSQILTIDITEIGEITAVELPASEIAKAANETPNAVISIQTASASYELPITLLDIAAIAQGMGVELKDLKVSVTMEQVGGATAAALQSKAAENGVTLLGDAIEFTITVEAGGSSKEVNDFGGTFVTRTITIPQPVDGATATAVMYDPVTGEMRFVPAQFVTENGRTKVIMKRNGNSIYTVVQSDRTYGDIGSHWAKRDIELLASKLILSGTSETAFAPNRSVTRAEFAAMLVRALGLNENKQAAAAFSDVSSEQWFAGSVGAAADAGIVTGFDGGVFKPGERITREQMAVMIARAIAFAGNPADAAGKTGLAAEFKDGANISSWARPAVLQAVHSGILSGRPDGTFAPVEAATRAEAATMLKRLLTHLEFID
ncbi:S-layer homology domain-containing protein [Paenibacillus thermotolerans]|uniref:S-layer homology domain-containing protein n=1 Tax=Paenibacillus thermotolerans TaxID=3027807 RepID=UPI002367A895|nr:MULTISPECIES: S-layer homology domain-containing protein [unclassified Paenibacillus]